MKTKLFLTVAIIASIGIAFIACGDDGDPADPPGYDNNKAPGATVASPTLAFKTHNIIAINTVSAGNGQTVEYTINTETAAPGFGWQEESVFTGLKPKTVYYVFARSKANSSFNAGAPSSGLSVTTDAAGSSGGTVEYVTVNPETAKVGTGHTLQFNASVYGTIYGTNAQTVIWSVTGGRSGTNISQSGLLTIDANETAAVLTVKAVSISDMSKSGTATVTVNMPSFWSVHDMATWGEAVNGIRNGGNNKAHTITVSGNISVLPTSSSENTFGSVTGISVNIEGNGTISMSGGGNGSLLYIGAGQTITVRNLTLQGRSGNNRPVVRIENKGEFRMAGSASVTGNSNSSLNGAGVYVGGNFIMQDNASVTGNISTGSALSAGGVYVYGGTFIMQDNASVTGNSANDGGGVHVESRGVFNMKSGTISGNTAIWGGGVYVVEGSSSGNVFIMDGGTISNNTVISAGALNPQAVGGGVYGSFTMKGGTISGNTVSAVNTGGTTAIVDTSALGGGVYATTLTMEGGTISGNTVSASNPNYSGGVIAQGGGVYTKTLIMEGGIISGNTVSASNSANRGTISIQGGGVFAASLTKTGGTIYGNDAADGLGNIAIGGQGHAVYRSKDSWRNAAAGPTINTDSYGFWLNEIDITYSVVHNGYPVTSFIFTFSEDPGNILARNITFDENVSRGNAAVTGSGTTRTLSPLTVSGDGIVTVSIPSVYKVETGSKTILLIPPDPTEDISTALSASTVRLDWNSCYLAAGYRVYRSTRVSGAYSLIGTTSSTSYTDINRSSSTTYYYNVTAFNSAGESDQYYFVPATTLENNTKMAIPASSDTIVVEWPRDEGFNIATRVTNLVLEVAGALIDLSTGIPGSLNIKTSYVIYRDEGFLREIEIPVSLTWTPIFPFYKFEPDSSKLNHFFVDTGRKPNTTYKYKVDANAYVEYGPLGLYKYEPREVMTVSATTWPR